MLHGAAIWQQLFFAINLLSPKPSNIKYTFYCLAVSYFGKRLAQTWSIYMVNRVNLWWHLAWRNPAQCSFNSCNCSPLYRVHVLLSPRSNASVFSLDLRCEFCARVHLALKDITFQGEIRSCTPHRVGPERAGTTNWSPDRAADCLCVWPSRSPLLASAQGCLEFFKRQRYPP